MLLCLWQPAAVFAQSRTKASIAFDYMPDQSTQRYTQRVPHKTIAVGNEAFILLNRSAADAYTVAKYNSNLKKQWSAEVRLNNTETVEAFFTSPEAAVVVTHRAGTGA